MDIISFNAASTANGRIEKVIANPDSTSGIVTVPKVIGAGESVTIPAGRVAVLPNVQVDGTLNIEGEVFIPSGATFSKVVETEGNQTIAGVKTFSSSPIVPTPTTDNQVANKKYVDDNITPEYNPTPTIATGTATFNSTTNNINLTGIGIGVEIGDVIQISGADDAKNNSEFTIEVITDANNIIVNQAHANKGTTKNVSARSGDTGVTVKLLSKYYNAPLGLGQAWLNMSGSRTSGPVYTNTTGRTIEVIGSTSTNDALFITVDGFTVYSVYANLVRNSATILVPSGSKYSIFAGSSWIWGELR